MDVTLRQIRSFVAAAKLGSFTRAADMLNVSQPTLTVQIKRLEETMGLRLFDRSPRSVRLTRIGRELIPAFERTLEELDVVFADIKGVSSARHGIIRIAALPSFAAGILPDFLRTFRQEHTGAIFSLKDVIADELLKLVRSDEVDIGLTGGDVSFPDVEILFTAHDHMNVIFPRTHPLAQRRKITAACLAEFPLIMMHRGTSVRAVTDAAFKEAGLIPSPTSEATYMMTAIGMVRAGIGITILPVSARETEAEPSLHRKLISDPRFSRPVALIKKRGRSLSPLIEAFVEQMILKRKTLFQT